MGGTVYTRIWQIVTYPEPTVVQCGLFALAQLMRADLFFANQPKEKGAENAFDASIFLYAAQYSRILIKQKYSKSLSPLL